MPKKASRKKSTKKRIDMTKKTLKKSNKKVNPYIRFVSGKTKDSKKMRKDFIKEYNEKYGDSDEKFKINSYVMSKMAEVWRNKKKMAGGEELESSFSEDSDLK